MSVVSRGFRGRLADAEYKEPTAPKYRLPGGPAWIGQRSVLARVCSESAGAKWVALSGDAGCVQVASKMLLNFRFWTQPPLRPPRQYWLNQAALGPLVVAGRTLLVSMGRGQSGF